jgi:hypothetical protein
MFSEGFQRISRRDPLSFSACNASEPLRGHASLLHRPHLPKLGIFFLCILHTGIPRFIALRRYWVFFYKLFLATLRRASLSAPFFQKHVLISCLCVTFWYFSKYLKHFQYYYICYGYLWSVIFDITIVNILGRHEPRPYKTANLIDKCCVCSERRINRFGILHCCLILRNSPSHPNLQQPPP